MLKVLTLTLLATALTANADMAVPGSGDETKLSAQDIRDRLQVRADVYVMDASGKRIIAGPLFTNEWKPSRETGMIKSDWSAGYQDEAIILRQALEVTEDGHLKFLYEEFEKKPEGEDSYSGSPIEKKSGEVENLAPIVMKIKNVKKHNLIVRYVTSLREMSAPLSVENLPLAGNGIMITDTNGYLWADNVQVQGKYVGVTTHRGRIVMSYLQFPGSKPIGVAGGNQIVIEVDKKYQIHLKGSSSFLPAGVTAKVYASYLPEKKTKSVHSTGSFETDKEDRLMEALKN